jgi:hypothetical protein
MEESPRLAPVPHDQATQEAPDRRGKRVPPPAKAAPEGTPGPGPPASPEAALSPSKTSWIALTGCSPRAARTMPRRLPAVARRVHTLARPTTRDEEKYPHTVQMAKGSCPRAPGAKPSCPSQPACSRCEKWMLSKSRHPPVHSASLNAATALGFLHAAPHVEQAHLPATKATVCLVTGGRGSRGALPARPACPSPKARDKKPAGTAAVAVSRSLAACRSSLIHLRP